MAVRSGVDRALRDDRGGGLARGAPPRPGRRPALVAWGVQLALNALWTPLFFAAEQYGAAFLDIALLLAAVVTTVLLTARVDRRAALLLVPYLLWVGYAAALNLSLWLNN